MTSTVIFIKYFKFSKSEYFVFISYIYPSSIFVTFAFSRAFFVTSEYAFTNPPVPNNIPPKYLVTITNILIKLFFDIIVSIGAPAVPDGSPSSLDFSIISSLLKTL